MTPYVILAIIVGLIVALPIVKYKLMMWDLRRSYRYPE